MKQHLFNNNAKGNALFLILIAVALFAALSYAVVQSNRSGGGSTNKEQAKLFAADILQYASLMESSIMHMRLSNECSDTMINFENPINNVRSFQKYENVNAPADKSCNVFDKEGGAVPIQATPKEALTPCCTGDVQPGEYGYQRYSGEGMAFIDNQSTPDLWMIVPSLKKEVCIALNDQLGVKNDNNGNPPSVSGTCFTTRTQFTGNYNGNATWCGLNETPSACVYDEHDGGVYYFYHILIRR